jgi:hypothetical protein
MPALERGTLKSGVFLADKGSDLLGLGAVIELGELDELLGLVAKSQG